jgi:flagellar biosynthesis protein FliP
MSEIMNKKNDEHINQDKSDVNLIRLLKIIMVSGFILILLGIYFHIYSDSMKAMGLTGLVISACCVAIGMIMSLPTKIYLTFVLVKREQEMSEAKKAKDTGKS